MDKIQEFIKENTVDKGFLQDWYQASILETDEPVWTDARISEVYEDFCLISKCVAEEIKGNISKDILNNDEELLLEVSKRFAKHVKDTIGFDVETGEVQDFQNLIEKIIECCEDNNWFNTQP